MLCHCCWTASGAYNDNAGGVYIEVDTRGTSWIQLPVSAAANDNCGAIATAAAATAASAATTNSASVSSEKMKTLLFT